MKLKSLVIALGLASSVALSPAAHASLLGKSMVWSGVILGGFAGAPVPGLALVAGGVYYDLKESPVAQFNPVEWSSLSDAQKTAWKYVISDAVRETCGDGVVAVQKWTPVSKSTFDSTIDKSWDVQKNEAAQLHQREPSMWDIHLGNHLVVDGAAHAGFTCIRQHQYGEEQKTINVGNGYVEAFVTQDGFHIVGSKIVTNWSLDDMVNRSNTIKARMDIDKNLF